MNTDLISVVMPAYNAEKFIQRSIESVIAQTYTNWELIIVDDGSTDTTKNIIFNFQKTEERIKYFYQQNGKQGKARNKGIENAKADLIAFMDADDVLLPFMLQSQYELLHKTKSDLVFSSVTCVDEALNDLNIHHGFPFKEIEGVAGAEILLQEGNPIPIITVVAKKKIIQNAGNFSTSSQLQFAEEYSLWIRMLLNNAKFARNDKIVALYIMHPNQSSRLAENKYLQMLEMINALPQINGFKKTINKFSCIWIRRCLKHNTDIDYKYLRKLIHFIPSVPARNICFFASYFLPLSFLKKMVYKFSYTKNPRK